MKINEVVLVEGQNLRHFLGGLAGKGSREVERDKEDKEYKKDMKKQQDTKVNSMIAAYKSKCGRTFSYNQIVNAQNKSNRTGQSVEEILGCQGPIKKKQSSPRSSNIDTSGNIAAARASR